ncbi:MAG: hypothetical protein HY560_04690 [Gemmatimonadetes bacterium]|nr:hypothetical protein [Gemmatimonadota bacterium]
MQALPGGRYLSGGIRFSSPRPVARGRAAQPTVPYVPRPGGGELRFTLPTATRVDVVGDWTGWRPVAMQRGPGGRWTLRVDLPSGVHRFSLVLNGEQWIVPDGVTAVDDGFGGKTGLLLVP